MAARNILATEEVSNTLGLLGGAPVSVVAADLVVSQSTVRRHLRLLLERGWVKGTYDYGLRATRYALTERGWQAFHTNGGSDVKRFEYQWVERIPPSRLVKTLNEYGQDGWQVIAFDFGGIVLMRQVTSETEEQKRLEQEHRHAMTMHLRDEHDTTLYIGNPFKEHAERHPDCTWTLTDQQETKTP